MKKLMLAITTMLMLVCLTVGLSFSASAYTVYESEDNGTYATADTVEVGDTVVGVLDNKDDYDYYKFVAPSDGKLSVDFCHTYENNDDGWDIEIYRYAGGEYYWVSGTSVMLNGNEKITVPFTGAVENGIYYIKVRVKDYYYDAVGHTYNMKINFIESDYYEKETNNTYATATNVNANNTYTGVLNNKDDFDYYKVVAPNDGKLTVKFCHTYIDNDDGWDIKIYKYANGEYTWISGSSVFLNGNEQVTIPVVGAEKNGIYYIVVNVKDYYYDAVGVDYELKIDFNKSSYYEKEPNSTYATATNTTVNNTYYGTLNGKDDYDYYKIVAPGNGKLTVNFCHTCVDNDDGWDIGIYKYSNGAYSKITGTSVLLQDADKISVFSENIVKNEVYYITVHVKGYYYDAVGEIYKLQINFNLDAEITNLDYTSTKSSVTLGWNKVSNISGYQIQQYKNGKWSTLDKINSNMYTITDLSKAESYNFRVRAYSTSSGKSYYTAWSNITATTRPDSTSLTAEGGKKKVTLSWNKVLGVNGYIIYRSTSKNGSYSRVATITSSRTTTYTNTNLISGKTYYYKIRTYIETEYGNVYSSYSSVKSAKTTPAAPTLKLIAGTKKVTLSWGKVTGADGYVIYRATSKNGTYKRLKSVGSSTTSYTNSGLTSNKTYYYKIRAYIKVNGSYVYSPYSTVKSVKTK